MPLRGERAFSDHQKTGWHGVSTVMAIVIVIVLYDFSDLKGKMDGYLSNSSDYGRGGGNQERIASSEDTDQGRDIVVTEKDLQRTYKDLLRKKEKEIEKVTIFEPENGSCLPGKSGYRQEPDCRYHPNGQKNGNDYRSSKEWSST